MGAQEFWQIGHGEDAKDAFRAAREQAQYDHGHAGYTGTLAEKHEFVLMGTAPTSEAANDMADAFMAARDPRITDKWGPAGCIAIEGGAATKGLSQAMSGEEILAASRDGKAFLFFGIASS